MLVFHRSCRGHVDDIVINLLDSIACQKAVNGARRGRRVLFIAKDGNHVYSESWRKFITLKFSNSYNYATYI